MVRGWWRRATQKQRRGCLELAGTLFLIGVIVWQYGSLAPRVIIVLSFLLSLALILVQLPFLAGHYGIRHFRPSLVVLIVVLPFLISWGYEFVYRKNLLGLFYGEWFGTEQAAVSALAVIALPLLSFLSGKLSRKYRRKSPAVAAEEDRTMPTFIEKAAVIQAAGNKPKFIEEYIGRVNTGTTAVSIARMQSPSGWTEPGQTPEFDEYTLVLKGMLRVESRSGAIDVHAGQAVITLRGEWIRYSSPGPDGAEYIAVCLPAFSPATVHREA
jgi:mannose-6-phosphate isomerase-like protein (cupin superfamily)